MAEEYSGLQLSVGSTRRQRSRNSILVGGRPSTLTPESSWSLNHVDRFHDLVFHVCQMAKKEFRHLLSRTACSMQRAEIEGREGLKGSQDWPLESFHDPFSLSSQYGHPVPGAHTDSHWRSGHCEGTCGSGWIQSQMWCATL